MIASAMFQEYSRACISMAGSACAVETAGSIGSLERVDSSGVAGNLNLADAPPVVKIAGISVGGSM